MKFMKRSILIIVLFSIILCLPLDCPASYYFFTGNKLVQMMKEWEKGENNVRGASSWDSAFFMGYVIGVWDATEGHLQSPGQVSIGQLCAIVAKYLKENPELWNAPASILVMDAFKKAFPK